ncbi:MAG TPA: dethiobiotin synthase [Fibrobacteraceae bacterium]|nr:dethiobiotin synthase [Fibrobacteraceae bacterium]
MDTSGLFVTGTGTDVGKTFASGFVLAVLRSLGSKSLYYKPIQCGPAQHLGKSFPDGDAQFIREILGHPDTANTWMLRKPSSPHLAFAMENVVFDAKRFQDALEVHRRNCDFLLVEGAGGIRVPINDTLDMADLASLSGLPVLVVSPPGLGTINHTLLTLEHLEHRQLPIAGFVFCENLPCADPDQLAADNARVIQARTGVSYLGAIPFWQELWPDSAVEHHPLRQYLSCCSHV